MNANEDCEWFNLVFNDIALKNINPVLLKILQKNCIVSEVLMREMTDRQIRSIRASAEELNGLFYPAT